MIKGWASKQKKGDQTYQTIQEIGTGKVGSDMIPKAVYAINPVTDYVPEAGSTSQSITLAGHTAKVGDIIRFTGGVLDAQEVGVSSIDGSSLEFLHKFAADVTAADTFKLMRHITLTISKDGELSTTSGPIQFTKDAAVVTVNEDTGTPANNIPLPVKLTGATGDINITAGDLNVQLSHLGVNADVTQIGDGTNKWGINASLEGLVKDTDLLAEQVLQKAILTALAAEDFSTEVTSAAILAKIIAAPATEAKQDIQEVSLDAILAKIIAAPATEAKQDTSKAVLDALLVELALKADLAETQPVSAASLPLPSGAATEVSLAALLAKVIAAPSTEAKQDIMEASLDAILAKIIAAPATEAKQDIMETSLDAILAKIIAAPATEAKQDVMETSLDAILAKIIAAPATEAKQDVIETTLNAIELSVAKEGVKVAVIPIDIGVNNIPATADVTGLELIASTATDLTKIQTIEDVGEYLGLYSGLPSALVLVCILPIAGGIVEVAIPSGTRLSIKHMKATAISTSTYFSANLIG